MKILLSLILSVVILSSGITAYAQSDSIPSWVKGIAEFWAEGKITDEEYTNAMEFLIKAGIIKVNYTIEPVVESEAVDPEPVAVEPPVDDAPICGAGTELVNDICQVVETQPVDDAPICGAGTKLVNDICQVVETQPVVEPEPVVEPASGTTIELDQNVYTWTDKIYITVVAPDHNLDNNLIDEIGNSPINSLNVTTRSSGLDQYKLVETGTDTGIFTGEVILTGFEYNADGDSTTGTNGNDVPSTPPKGNGPTNGFLPSSNDDGLTVSFEFSENETVVSSALIRWNIGEAQWLEASYPASGTGIVRVIDPDMNLNPEAVDNFDVDVFSDSDAGGISLTVTETSEATGIFEGTVFFTTADSSSGNRLRVAEGDTVTAEYEDNTLPGPYTTADELHITATTLIDIVETQRVVEPASGTKIELDQTVYTWTDKIYITVVAPDHNLDNNLIDEIGNSPINSLNVTTRLSELYQYKLVETDTDTGIFIGAVTLTGFEYNADGDSTTGEDGNDVVSSSPRGNGPTDGFLPASNDDGLTVSFEFSEGETVVSSALIRWNIGEVQWFEASYPASGTGIVRVIDPDMNFNPKAVNNFDVDVFSDSDAGGISLTLTETNEATGIFEGIVYFTIVDESSGNRLRVAEGDTVTAEYEDNTLPGPYTTADELHIAATTLIDIVESDTAEVEPDTSEVEPEESVDIGLDESQITLLSVSSPVEFVDDGQEVKRAKNQRMPAPHNVYERITDAIKTGLTANEKDGVARIPTPAPHEKYSTHADGFYPADWMPTYIPDGQKLLYSETFCSERTDRCQLYLVFVPTTFVLNADVTNYDMDIAKGFEIFADYRPYGQDETEDKIEEISEIFESQDGNYAEFRDMTRNGKILMAMEGGTDSNHYRASVSMNIDEYTAFGVNSNYHTLDEMILVFDTLWN